MDRSKRRLLAAGAATAALLSGSHIPPAHAAVVPPPAPCTTVACAYDRLEGEITALAHEAVHVRDLRGLTDAVRLPHARRAGDLVALATTRARLDSAINRLQHTRPIWRTLDRWSQWMCIHVGEGAWNSVDGIYRGGLQMDSGFQASYGSDMLRRYGSAERWPIAAQVLVAERAFAVRGFNPWPNTARACGLL
jgi:hypothetical protein